MKKEHIERKKTYAFGIFFLMAVLIVGGATGCGNSGGGSTSSSASAPPAADKTPIANIDATKKNMPVRVAVQLDGSKSNDPDKNTLTYRWSITSVPAGSTAKLADVKTAAATTSSTTFTPDIIGDYTIQLVVNNGTLDSTPNTITVSAINTPPVANAGADQNYLIAGGNTLQLDASGSSDLNGDTITYNWSITSAPEGSTASVSDPISALPAFTPDVAGSYAISLSVNDGTSDSAPNTMTLTQKKVAVYGDTTYTKISDFLAEKGLAVDNAVRTPDSENSHINGDFIVWEDKRNGGDYDIYAYKISTKEEFAVTTAANSQQSPVIDGDYIVWADNRNENFDIYAYQISTGTEFEVAIADNNQNSPQISGDFIVWRDLRNVSPAIYGYQISNPTTNGFPVTDNTAIPDNPKISGDYIVWSDQRNGNYDIYAFNLLDQILNGFEVTDDSSNQKSPQVSGDYIVWTDYRNEAARDIYAYQISASSVNGFAVVTAPDEQIAPHIDGDYVVWEDYRNVDSDGDIYARNIATMDPEIAITSDSAEQTSPQVNNGNIVWEDLRNGYAYNIHLSTDQGVTEINITTDKTDHNYLVNNITDYAMILFGDSLDSSTRPLELFDAADFAGVNMLGIGTDENDRPLGILLGENNRFGLFEKNYDGISPMEIETTTAWVEHTIFTGIDVSDTIYLEENEAITKDEQSYGTDRDDPASPADWTVLAEMGQNMRLSGRSAIVEFTTPSNTKVILDGSANTNDNYSYWADTRWDLLYNEVIYLAQ